MAIEPGTTLAGYEITGVLGQGGMGVVYEATQISLNRTVALKVLAPHLGDDILFRERFVREGQIQAGMEHAHIVTVYEAGTSEHGFFIAMRLIRGPNLKDMIVSRELDPGRTLRILTPIAEALDVAHAAGLIHRDIKPQNILVGSMDQAFLADFGLTKASGEKSLTRTGQFVGTFDYISPEQIKGERATKRSDVYALAAVLYECLSGLVPFPKDSEAAVLYAHMAEDAPKLTEQRPELPATLDEVIAKGMAKDPAERYDSGGQLLLEANRSFTRRTRAAFTPPRPIETPQETGIRSAEVDVPTRQSPAAEPPTEEGALEAETQSPELGETVIGAAAAGAAGAAAAETAAEAAPAETTPAEAIPAETAAEAAPPETASGATAPVKDAPEETAPGEGPPAESGPSETVVGAVPTAAPGETAPGETAPGETAPGETAPGETAPGEEGLDETAPGETAPDATQPGEDAPGSLDETAAAAVPDVTVPGQAAAAETVHAASPSAPPGETAVPPPKEPVSGEISDTGVPPGSQPGAPSLEATRHGETGGAAAAGAAATAATGDTAAASPPSREAPARRAGTPVLIAAAAAVALVVVALGYLIGSSGGDSEESSSTPAGSSVATGGSLEVSYPNTWKRTSQPPAIPGLELRNPIALNERGRPSSDALVTGMTDATGPALLPASFLSLLDEAPPRDDAVKSGETEAYRYEDLQPEGFDGSLTLYVVPTTDGVATVACTAASKPAEFLPACEEVATGIRLVNGDVFALGADEDYLAQLDKTISALNSGRKQGVSALNKAKTPSKQATAAQSLAKTYARARQQLSGLTISPAVVDANAAVRAALLKSQKAYSSLASAAKNSKQAAYDKARADVRAGDTALQRALKQVDNAS